MMIEDFETKLLLVFGWFGFVVLVAILAIILNRGEKIEVSDNT